MLGDVKISSDALVGILVGSLGILLLLVAGVLAYRRKVVSDRLKLFAARRRHARSVALLGRQEEELKELRLRLESLEDSSHREMLLFSEIASILGNIQNTEESLKAAFGRMLEILSIDFGLLELSGRRTMAVKIFRGCNESLLETLELIGVRGWVLQEKAPPFSALTFEEYQRSRHLRVMEAAHSLLCLPCKVQAVQVGYFLVGYHRPHHFSGVELDGLHFCAEQLAVTYQMYTQLLDTQELSQLRHDYIANVSHELRTPLTTIYGYLNILKSYPAQLFQEEEKQEMFSIMNDECQRLIRLINNLLLSVKVEQEDFWRTMNPVCISLSQVVAQTCRFMDRELKTKNVEVEIDVPEGLGPIEGNLDLLYQVFQNLIANSIKFSAKDPRIVVSAREEGNSISVQVSDNGVGIEPQAIPRIFQKFYRAESQAAKRPGLGIGLYLVRRLVELHDGEINVTSEVGKGTTFTMKFPKSETVANVSERAAV
jgi:signal transduction histidine kinase